MTYERINFVDQSVERPRTYEMTHNADGSITLTDSFGLVDELGTPINADTMNHLEDGIAAVAIRKYSLNETYALGEWVLATVENETNFYKSLKDNNLGNPLTDTNYWEVVKIGSGASREVGEFVTGFWSASHVPENLLYCGDGTEFSGAEGQMFRNMYVDYLTGKNSLTNGITITGNLMNANGVLSNFSGSNYFNLKNAYSKVVIAFKLSDVITKQMLYTDEFLSYSLRIEDGALNRYYYSAPNTITKETVCALTANANYELHLSNLTDGKYKTIAIYKNGSLVIEQSGVSGIKATSNFGYGVTTDYETSSSTGWADATIYPFLGTIDLNNSYYEGSKLDTCSYAEYETEVTMTGSCWKWAVDTANEKFRIPFIPDKVLTDIDDNIGVRGNGIGLGVTDGTTNGTLVGDFINGGAHYGVYSRPSLYGSSVGTPNAKLEYLDDVVIGLVPDTSKSGIEADAASAKTYKTIRHYVVVATGSINQSEADWSEFASSLASKANIDLSNVTQSSGLRRLIEVSDSSLMPSWYKVFEETNPQTGEVKKWCEQGGLVAGGSNTDDVTLLRNFVDRNYSVITTHNYTASTSNYGSIVNIVNNSSFTIYSHGDGAKKCNKIWQASGYIS